MKAQQQWNWREASNVMVWYQHGATEPWTAAVVREITRAKLWDAPKGAFVLETGTFKGTTPRELLEAMAMLQEGTLLSVESDHDRAVQANAWLEPWKPSRLTLEVREADALEVIAGLRDSTVDVAFIDDDHDKAHVFREMELLHPKMKPGGIILLHDVFGVFGLKDVVDFYGGTSLALPRMHAGGGLGLVTIPA